MTNEQLVQSFIDGATSGKNSNGTLFIKGHILYSYGYHFPLAKWTYDEGFVVNPNKYSPTTSRHASLVMKCSNYTAKWGETLF